LPAISAQRKTEPAKLAKLVRGELDWIVMKALEKDRTRRYETANGLARDIERYLGGDPVEAGPPSAGYRLRKFARKYRTPLRLVAAVGLLLTFAAALSTWQAIRATRAERAVRQERDRAVEAEAEAKAVVDFLRNDLLAQGISEEGLSLWPAIIDPELKVRTLLDRAAGGIGGKFSRQPLVEATIRETIGSAYMALGRIAQAEQELERALNLRQREQGVDAPAVLRAMANLTWLYLNQVKDRQAETLGEKTLELCRRVYGEEHPETLGVMSVLSFINMVHGKYAEAGPQITRNLEICRRVLGEDQVMTLLAMGQLADFLRCQGRLAEAESLMTKSLEASRRVVGEEHLATIGAMGRLGELYLSQGKYQQAEPLLTKSAEVSRRIMGQEHLLTQGALRLLGRLHLYRGEYRQAESLFTKTLEDSRRLWNDEMSWAQLAMSEVVNCYMAQDKYAQAKPLISKWLEINHGESSETSFRPWATSYLAWFLANSPESSRDRDPARSVDLAKKAVAATPQEGSFWHMLGVAQYRAGDWKLALTALEKGMGLPKLVGLARDDCTDRIFLAMTRWRLGHHDEARQWYDQAVEWMETRKRRDPELLRFRTEAAALLGIKEQPEPKPK
jgi:tetratricopeptide (TPR) repeat protein